MRIRIPKARRAKINRLGAETVQAQRAAIEALAAALERRRQKEPPFLWDDSVLAELAATPMPTFEPFDLPEFEPLDPALFEPIDLAPLLAELQPEAPAAQPGRVVSIDISEDS